MKQNITLLLIIISCGIGCASLKPTPPIVNITPLPESLHETRQRFSLIQVSDDAWLVTGGYLEVDLPDKITSKISDTAEMIHLVSDQRIVVHPLEAKMLVKRWGHRATPLQNGDIFICGGSSDRRCEIFSIKERKFKLAGRLTQARLAPAQILLKNGKVLITGGYNMDETTKAAAEYLSSAEIYDPQTNQITMVGSMKIARAAHVMVEFENKVYVIGGKTPETAMIETFDLDSGKFIKTSMRLPFAIKDFQSHQIGSEIYLIGGTKPDGHSTDKILKVNLLDQTITLLVGHLQEPREEVALCPSHNPYKVLILSGEIKGNGKNGQHSKKTELISFDPFQITPLKLEIDRNEAQTIPLTKGGCLVVGGTNAKEQVQVSLLRVNY